MCFNGNDSKENDNEVRIQWRVADIKIPNNEIKNISQDQDIHAVPDENGKEISRIGSTFGKNKSRNYRY